MMIKLKPNYHTESTMPAIMSCLLYAWLLGYL